MTNGLKTREYNLTPAAGKRLIAKALLEVSEINEALSSRTVVIIAGTTNAYIAEEILKKINQTGDFNRSRFYRGITLPPKYKKAETDAEFLGDVIIINGKWEKGKTIFDVADQLKMGDVIIKGANAVNLEDMQAAILIGNPMAGTISPVLQCSVGRRVSLYLPVGLGKRVTGDIDKIARKLNSPDTTGLRYMPVNGNIITELQAVSILCGAEAELIAGGGVCGAEGTVWLAVTGTKEQLDKLDEVYKSVHEEPNYIL